MTPGNCKACGAADLVLAVDVTEYRAATWTDGAWVLGETYRQAIDAPDAVRVFCASCGEPHEVPEGLK